MAKWLKAVARENWMPSPRATLCSDHFTKDCFEERNDRRHLKFYSIPTIFPPPKNKMTSSQRSHKAKASGGHHKILEIQKSHSASQANSVSDAFCKPTEPTNVTDLQPTLVTETLNTGKLAQLAAAAVLNLAEFSQILEVPLKPEVESSEVPTFFNCTAQNQTYATEAKTESVLSESVTNHSEDQFQDSAAAQSSDTFQWTANVLSTPEVLSDTSTVLVSSVDVPIVSTDVLPCLFATSTELTSEQVTISEETTWISAEVLIPETPTHLTTAVLASEELEHSSAEGNTLSSPSDQNVSGMTFPQDHSYFMSPCPDIIRRTLGKKLAWERKKNEEHRQKFRVLQQKLKRKEQKIDNLTKIISQLREKHDESEKEELDQTQQCY
ncbi:THAP domain-containing protein 5-like isoform X2 [Stegostoma tigrinum]|nr:THAP domain-containing protein 5-like isoform X2 [Stegostoma tigrinum]XP_048397919.1 THAP domain-containing protein 5-like isoform X2 [Stegostoma tigrinum]